MSWKVSYNNMAKQRTIRWKALIMLVSFTTSFTVFCHCETTATKAAATFHLETLPMVLVELSPINPKNE
jgi:hypothetical protein